MARGSGSQAIKLVFCLRRLPHLSRREFQRHWADKHAPLVEKNAAALRIQKYVQVHTSDDVLTEALRASRGAPHEYDGVAEIWWRSRDDMESALSSPEGQRAGRELLEDESKFIDLPSSPLWIAVERPILARRTIPKTRAATAAATKKPGAKATAARSKKRARGTSPRAPKKKATR